MRFLILQHLDIEPAALIGEVLEQAGHRLTVCHPDQEQALPAAVTEYDGIVIMGGPQSANDDTPCMQGELAWLETVIQTGIPMLGICLGAQLMARAAGADIVAAPVRELGWFPVYHSNETVDDPLFCKMPDGLAVFQWHGETFSRTDAMTMVAMHPDVPSQAFRLGRGQYGLQFHVEINAAIIECWIAYGASERDHLGIEGVRLLHKDTTLYLEAMQYFCRQMVQAWIQEITAIQHDGNRA